MVGMSTFKLVRTRTGTPRLVEEARKWFLILRQNVSKMPQSQGGTDNPGRLNTEG